MENKKLLIITGVQRSGNSLLAKLIGNHSSIKMEIDPSLTTIFNSHNLLIKNINNHDLGNKEFIKGKILTNLNYWHPERLGNFDFNNWNENTFQSYLNYKVKDDNEMYLGAKIPDYCNKLEEIELLANDVKYINVIRDPRNVIYSQMSKINTSLLKSVLAWKKSFFKSSYYQVIFGSKKYLNIRYEDLIKKPEIELKKVCDFLEIKFEKEMLNLKDKETSQKESYIIPYFDNNKLEAYKRNLTLRQINKIESYCNKEMKFLGYPLTNKDSKHKNLTKFKLIINEFLIEFRNVFISKKMHMTGNKLKKIRIPLKTRLKSFILFCGNSLLPKNVIDILTSNNKL